MSALDSFGQLRSAPHFSKLVADVDEVVGTRVRAYASTLPPGGAAGTQAKAVKDSVWGMIDFQPREVLVLDSPPVQRLRRIKQLGLSYLTYPTAGYSRFEHALGACHQAERMLRAIALRSGEFADAIGAAASRVRLAALLHDVGHLPLSHVSERYFTEKECADDTVLGSVTELLDEISLTMNVPGVALAEALSVAIIATESFHELLTSSIGYSAEDVAVAAMAIIGRPPSVEQAFIAQIITNVVDADKLDYMFRDAAATGVPLAVDLERLLYKLKCVPVKAGELPTVALREMANADAHGLVLATDVPGDRLIYDLSLSRAMLYQRVYMHHKTRAAERVALRALADLAPRPAQLLASDDGLFEGIGAITSSEALAEPTQRLTERRLPRRAFAMSYEFLQTPSPGKPAVEAVDDRDKDAWEELTDVLDVAALRQRLEDDILQRARQLVDKLGVTAAAPERIYVDTSPSARDAGNNTMLVERPDKQRAPGTAFQAKASTFTHDPLSWSHVFYDGPTQAAPIVYLATEMALAASLDLHLGDNAAHFAKVDLREVNDYKRALEDQDLSLFAGDRRLRPPALKVERHVIAERIGALSARFASYAGSGQERVDDARIVHFLDQFPERFIEPLLELLERIRYLDQAQGLGGEYAAYLLADAADGEHFCPLTDNLTKSAAAMPHNLRGGLAYQRLRDSLGGDHPRTLFDDVCISGKQARTVIQTWLGLEKDLDEDLATALAPEHLRRLAEDPLRFRFAYATPAGLSAVQALADENGLGADVAAMIVDDSDPFARVNQGKELRSFLEDCGTQLLASTKGVENGDKWTAKRCADFALGYGGAKRLVVTYGNTPTGTITALWSRGTYGGQAWLPLFPRRESSEAAREDE